MNTTKTDVQFAQDSIGMIDWAFLPDSIFALARFTSDGKVYLVANATTPQHNVAGSFHKMRHTQYEYAPTYAAFKELAVAFDNDTTGEQTT